MRHAEPRREDLSVKPSLLFYHPTGRVHRASCRTAHVLGLELLCSEHRAGTDELCRLLVQEVSTQIADALVETRGLLGEALVADRALRLPGALTL